MAMLDMEAGLLLSKLQPLVLALQNEIDMLQHIGEAKRSILAKKPSKTELT